MKKNIILFVLAILANVTIAAAQKQTKAEKVFLEYVNSVGTSDPSVTASYFAENGAIELPYVAMLGMHDKVVGRDSIAAVVGGLLKNAPGFRLKNVKVIMADDEKVLAEYESETLLPNGRTYKQHYMGYAIVKNGKIVLHREVMNTIVLVSAFFPNGLKDLIKE